jgi:hypothetical protein
MSPFFIAHFIAKSGGTFPDLPRRICIRSLIIPCVYIRRERETKPGTASASGTISDPNLLYPIREYGAMARKNRQEGNLSGFKE